MRCDICRRPPSNRLSFTCTFCARNALYQPRIQLAQTLLQIEALGKEVDQKINGSSGRDGATKTPVKRVSEPGCTWAVQRASAEQAATGERTRLVYDHIQALQEEIQKTKADLATRKQKILRRRSDIASAKQELSQCQPDPKEASEKAMRRTGYQWEMLHNRTAESRIFLCREAALLYGLQQRKRKKGDLGRDVYLIGGVPIADLRDLNSEYKAPFLGQ